jgi:hypothetical protein
MLDIPAVYKMNIRRVTIVSMMNGRIPACASIMVTKVNKVPNAPRETANLLLSQAS